MGGGGGRGGWGERGAEEIVVGDKKISARSSTRGGPGWEASRSVGKRGGGGRRAGKERPEMIIAGVGGGAGVGGRVEGGGGRGIRVMSWRWSVAGLCSRGRREGVNKEVYGRGR